MQSTKYDVIVVGGGASGTALLYVLARYTNLARIALVEKYEELATVNSNAKNNSQTLHVGDIETNYSVEKVRQVKPAAMMVKRYTDSLPAEERDSIIKQVQKMVLGVGQEEVDELQRRYAEIKELFPELEMLDDSGIAEAEPEVMRGRSKDEPVLALRNPQGFAVNYGRLARSFAKRAQETEGKHVELFLGRMVTTVEKEAGGYRLATSQGDMHARFVVFDTDAYSLGFAKSLGYGGEFSLIPVAGSFYFTPEKLRGKVYRVQEKRMPFAAVHGDPELTRPGVTRWGPTARFYPVLEARKIKTAKAFFASAGIFRVKTLMSFISILLEPIRFWYLVQNFFYDLPFVGVFFFAPQVKKIIPALRAGEITRAEGYGGMRLQRVNTDTRELLLGEGKIVGDNIIFNMSPSPGASVSLYNAVRDAEQLMEFDPSITFDKDKMLGELCIPKLPVPDEDVSLQESYAS